MTHGTNSPLPLWLLHEDEIDAWRAGQSPLVRQWLVEQNFKAEKHRVVLLPDAAGGAATASPSFFALVQLLPLRTPTTTS